LSKIEKEVEKELMNGNGVGSYGSIKKKVSESMLGNRESNNKKIVTKIVKKGKSKN
jgi:hypothetical protein